MTAQLKIPSHHGPVAVSLEDAPARSHPTSPLRSRVFFAAAHVVADPLAESWDAGSSRAIDWDSTLAYRRYLWSWGLGVAEAMDTAQRGAGLTWIQACELIDRSAAEARASHMPIVCGVGTDQLPATASQLSEVILAYHEQLARAQAAGARVVIMASEALARIATSSADYRSVYKEIFCEVEKPAILHWLGPMFAPSLQGYWGADDLDAAAETLLTIINDHAPLVDGIKVSLLDAEREISLRRRLPDGVQMYTGDDFNYVDLIAGDETSHSQALLGIFDAIAPIASESLQALDAGDGDRFRQTLEPTLTLARHIFAEPTRYYKAGLVFLAYLNGHQRHFRMVGGLESARSVSHLCRVAVLASEAGLIVDPELAAHRVEHLLALAGFE